MVWGKKYEFVKWNGKWKGDAVCVFLDLHYMLSALHINDTPQELANAFWPKPSVNMHSICEFSLVRCAKSKENAYFSRMDWVCCTLSEIKVQKNGLCITHARF